MGDAWFPWRAQTLGISVDEARQRDAALPSGDDGEAPPGDTLDEYTAREASAIWRSDCSACHGLDGKAPAVAENDPVPKSWNGLGPTMGFLFGGDKMRAGIYRSIDRGKPPAMPAWGSRLSREQIWALVRHIEGF